MDEKKTNPVCGFLLSIRNGHDFDFLRKQYKVSVTVAPKKKGRRLE